MRMHTLEGDRTVQKFGNFDTGSIYVFDNYKSGWIDSLTFRVLNELKCYWMGDQAIIFSHGFIKTLSWERQICAEFFTIGCCQHTNSTVCLWVLMMPMPKKKKKTPNVFMLSLQKKIIIQLKYNAIDDIIIHVHGFRNLQPFEFIFLSVFHLFFFLFSQIFSLTNPKRLDIVVGDRKD